jgi:para-aminobenzoate synthetase component 1
LPSGLSLSGFDIEGRKDFFFEKKKQKTFANLGIDSHFALPWVEPIELFRCFADEPFVAFLESAGAPGPRSRYSYLCIDPFRILHNASLDELSAELMQCRRDAPSAPVPFTGGAVGFCGYEMAAALERVPRAPGHFDGVPDMQFGLYDLVFAWDHAAHRMWLCFPSGDPDSRATATLNRLAQTGRRDHGTPDLQWRECVPRAAHMARVCRTLDYLHAGDIYQANITAPFEADRPQGLAAADIFLALRAGNPAPFTAYIDCGNGCAVASVSPERFLRLDASGQIEARPIKGTRPRGATQAEDVAQAEALLASDKDRAENLMIVDLLRNDISRVALPGSVQVPSLCALESFASVHHLVSTVQGQLHPDRTAIDLLRAAFPSGSITGAPKLRAMEIIAELEGRARGPYCGTAAWFGFNGAMDSSVLIRTVTVASDRIIAQAGGGIVVQSDPADEWEELLVKLRPMLRALGGSL